MFSVPEGKHHDGEYLAHRTMRLAWQSASGVIAFHLDEEVGEWGGAANDLSSSKAPLHNSSITPSPAGDRGLKTRDLWGTSCIQITKVNKSHNPPPFFCQFWSFSAFEMLGLFGKETFCHVRAGDNSLRVYIVPCPWRRKVGI